MGWLNSEKPPAKWDSGYFKMFVERLRVAVNYLDENNFKNGIFGSWIKDKSISMTKLSGGLYEIGIVALATAYSATNTELANVSGLVHWEPSIFPSTARCYLELTGTASNAETTATFELHGAEGKITSVTSSSAGFEWLRSEAFEPLSKAQTLVLKAKTSNATYPAGLLNAKIVIIL